MTRFNIPTIPQTPKTPSVPSTWVRTSVEGTERYSLTIMEKTRPPKGPDRPCCAYAQLSLMESGAIMATFPVMGMVSDTIRSMLGAAWFELATPLQLPAFVFGQDIEIPAGRHPIVFALESWIILFRPQNILRL
jgi:hypothetical protein